MSYKNLQITFLGTGTSSGVPMIACHCDVCSSTDKKDNRLRPCVMIETPQTTIVIDAGPDFRAQMLREKVQRVDAILITHSHKDHIAGLDDVRGFNYFNQRAMEVYASADAQKKILTEFDYSFHEKKYPGVPSINLHTIEQGKPFQINELTIEPISVLHYKMPVLGFRINNFTYITDANFIADAEKEKIKGSKIFVLNALRKEKHLSHFTLSEAMQIADELKIPQTYFTHISHQLGLHKEINKELPPNMALAYDGLRVNC